MRRKLVAGNWKMNTSRGEALELASALARRYAAPGRVDVMIAPPFVWLEAVASVIDSSAVLLAGQNAWHVSERLDPELPLPPAQVRAAIAGVGFTPRVTVATALRLAPGQVLLNDLSNAPAPVTICGRLGWRYPRRTCRCSSSRRLAISGSRCGHSRR